jgi:hypothetical protein
MLTSVPLSLLFKVVCSSDGEEGDSTWGYRIIAYPLADPSLASGSFLATLLAPRAATDVARASVLLEGLLDILQVAQVLKRSDQDE